MINPSAIMAAPFAAASLALPATSPVTAADLWREGVHLEWWELSDLLQECTGWAIKPGHCPDDPDEVGHWLIDPSGDPEGEIWPGPDTDDLENYVGCRMDEALALLDS